MTDRKTVYVHTRRDVQAELESHLAALEAWADHLPHHAECATFWGWSAKPTPECNCYLSRRPKTN